MTPEKQLELAKIHVELVKAQRAFGKDDSSENRSKVQRLHRQYEEVRLGPAVPKPRNFAKLGDTRTAMKLTPREPERQKRQPAFVHRPDVEWCDEIGQWVGV